MKRNSSLTSRRPPHSGKSGNVLAEGELLYRYRDSTYSGRPPTATERVPHRQRAQRVFRSDRGVQATHLTTFYRIPGSNEFIEVCSCELHSSLAGSQHSVD